MQTATLTRGTVKYSAGQPRQTQYGERINVVISLTNGEDVKLWGNPGDAIAYLRKGQLVHLYHDGKSYKLIATDDRPKPPSEGEASDSPRRPIEPTDEDIQEIVAIFRQLRLALPDAKEETCRAFASTLFMQRYSAEI